MKHLQNMGRVARRGSRQSGLTLVELMVAMAIGLFVALAIALAMLTMGRQFQVVGANSSAQVSAQIALSLIDDAGRAAGSGLFSDGKLVCPTTNMWRNGAIVSNGAALAPARIVDGGGNTASDTLIFTASKDSGALSSMPVVDSMATPVSAIVVTDAGLIAQNELAVVGVPGSTVVPCTLFQVTAVPTTGVACGGNATQCKTLQKTVNAGAGYNPPAGTFANEPRYGFTNGGGVSGPAAVLRLGSEVRQEAFAVQCGTLIQYNAFTDAPACTQNPLGFTGGANALATDVVLMHAQYGISAIATSDVVTNWVDATGGWANPGAADVGRIKAVRIVVVVRSKEPDSDQVTAASCANGGGVVNTGPCSFDDAEAPAIDLSAVAVPGGRSWRNYRYRVHQAVIPLRNVIWSSS